MNNLSFRNPLVDLLSENWWMVLIRGGAALIFGLLTWFYPFISILIMVMFFGVYALIDGVLGVVIAINGRRTHQDWWLMLIWGMVSILAGIMTFFVPGITWLVLITFIAIWSLVSGILQIIAAIRLRKSIRGEGWMIVAGMLSVLVGIILFVNPVQGGIALTWVIGVYAALFGVMNIALAFRLRRFAASGND
ncbi:MAG: HdeD family acid-resistance protein [Snodgrassella sp.]|uniref:HdeD family acid-resistance protein n=1 Tax=Snodgrassella sp. TaxID=2815304 RepID=UPI002588DA45|nr:HdeD family acid-resistance protein [Snodgrassella sp.]MCO6505733.1 HdeD family acid-resistance protein [Snodgrassella sp.]MCO6514190.1 HdeD family acid-resistance protein [Snodgrassella sp.]MCO6526377.1 HdeD family acid-resistance protein [Snodgrassella sp.]